MTRFELAAIASENYEIPVAPRLETGHRQILIFTSAEDFRKFVKLRRQMLLRQLGFLRTDFCQN